MERPYYVELCNSAYNHRNIFPLGKKYYRSIINRMIICEECFAAWIDQDATNISQNVVSKMDLAVRSGHMMMDYTSDNIDMEFSIPMVKFVAPFFNSKGGIYNRYHVRLKVFTDKSNPEAVSPPIYGRIDIEIINGTSETDITKYHSIFKVRYDDPRCESHEMWAKRVKATVQYYLAVYFNSFFDPMTEEAAYQEMQYKAAPSRKKYESCDQKCKHPHYYDVDSGDVVIEIKEKYECPCTEDHSHTDPMIDTEDNCGCKDRPTIEIPVSPQHHHHHDHIPERRPPMTSSHHITTEFSPSILLPDGGAGFKPQFEVDPFITLEIKPNYDCTCDDDDIPEYPDTPIIKDPNEPSGEYVKSKNISPLNW